MQGCGVFYILLQSRKVFIEAGVGDYCAAGIVDPCLAICNHSCYGETHGYTVIPMGFDQSGKAAPAQVSFHRRCFVISLEDIAVLWNVHGLHMKGFAYERQY